MYAADVDGKRHTFQASGSLWQDALVLQDVESESLWSQISGESIQGEQLGKNLELYNNFSHSTYVEFKKNYPSGTMLVKEELGRAGSRYDNYFVDSTKFGIFGRADIFTKMSGKEIVFGLRLDCKDIAISKSFLIKNKYYAIDCDEKTIIICYDEKTGSIRAHNTHYRKVGNHLLCYWNENQLKSFDAVPVMTSFWFAWISFFPETELIH